MGRTSLLGILLFFIIHILKPTQATDTQQWINEEITSQIVTVFAKSECPYSAKAKSVFQEMIDNGDLSAEDYHAIDIDTLSNIDPDMDDIQDVLKDMTGERSVSNGCLTLRVLTVC